MHTIQRIWRHSTHACGHRSSAQSLRILGSISGLILLFFFVASAYAQSTFVITSATYGTAATSSIPAGINGLTLQLGGTLPSAAQQATTGYLGCFYTGYGSTAGFPLSLPNGTNAEPLTVPASTIQAIPASQFTAADGYSLTAYVYFVAPGGTCDGNFDATLTNRYPVSVVAPSLGTYSGPIAVPQTNSATSLRAAPLTLTLPASGILPSASTLGATSVVFGTFGSVTPVTTLSSLTVPVPAAFASSAPGTTASLQVCNTFGTTSVCTTPTPAITITVAALTASAGTITATPTPVSAAGQTVLKAQFQKAAGAASPANPGVPSGVVTFAADGATVPAASLVLDTTATFATQITAVTPPVAPTPTITPAAGSYFGAQTITIADSNPTATIYYSQDGSAPTSGSTPYTAPFVIASSQTINAIAAVAGSLNSAVASAAYVVTIRPPTHLAFQVQPVNTALNTAITPAVQVALLDATGAVALGTTNAVTLAIRANPGASTLAGTATVNAVNGVATFPNLALNNLGTGYTLAASSGSLTGAVSAAFNITPPPITMKVQSELVGIGSTLTGTFTLGAPAPTGGLAVNLSSGTPANVTIAPATVTVAAGQTTGNFTYSGVAAGNSTLTATATGYQTGTVMTTGTAAQVSLGVIPAVAPGQTQSLALSLATAAPAGGTTVTFTIANTSIATVTSSVFVPAGQFVAATNPQVAGVLIGTTTVTANAPGYAPATRAVTVTVTGSFNPGTTNLNLITSTNTVLNISAPAPAGGIKFNLTSDDPTLATVAASVTVLAGGTTVKVPITGVADGTTTIRANSAGIAEVDGTVTVRSAITEPAVITGYGLQTQVGINLPVSPSTPTTVTITSNDPSVALISASNTAVGQKTLTFQNITSSGVATISIQGKKVGTTTLTISAPGYTTGSESITVLNTGFVYYGSPVFSTTDYSAPSNLTIYPVPLNADTSVYGFFNWSINPGSAVINVPVSSSSPAIGTVVSPVVFKAGDTQESFNFTPVAVGTTNITVGTPPAGFTLSNQYEQAVITVNTPVIIAPVPVTGTDLQVAQNINLPVNPPAGVTVTVSIAPSGGKVIASLSKSATAAGTNSLTFTNTTSSGVGTIYVQGLSTGTATLTVSAPGYTSGTSTVTVLASGFVYYGSPTFTTTSFSSTSQLTAYPVPLNSDGSVYSYFNWSLSPGVGPVTVLIADSATSAGTISPTSLVFNTNDTAQSFNFQPVSAGTVNLTIGTPTGFSTPSQYTVATATVTAPAISVGSQTTGVHFQQGLGISLPVAPPSATTVTVTVSAPTIATIAKDNVTVGTTTLTFTNVTTAYLGTIYLQGQSAGTVTITVSAPGYVTGTGTQTVLPSGFAFYGPPTFTTTTFSSPNSVALYPVTLNPGSLTIQNFGYPLSPGVGPITVGITNATPSVGTISSDTLVFSTNDTVKTFTFTPVSAGTTSLGVAATPIGFSTPSQYQTGTATVSAPAISVGNIDTGVKLEAALGIQLPQTPPDPVTVTITSNGPQFALLSKDATTVGSTTLTFTNVTSTSVGTIYVQGVGLGATTLKVSAPGYTDGSSVATVYDTGFAFYGSPSFTVSAGSSPAQLGIYPVLLNHGTLTVYTYNTQYISPQTGVVNVPAASSDTAVGTVVTPIAFPVGSSSGTLNFTPLTTGSSTLTLGTPPGFSTPSQYVTAAATVQ